MVSLCYLNQKVDGLIILQKPHVTKASGKNQKLQNTVDSISVIGLMLGH